MVSCQGPYVAIGMGEVGEQLAAPNTNATPKLGNQAKSGKQHPNDNQSGIRVDNQR